MFFAWFSENKQFKKRSGVSGQITPFLLVVLVILLIAAIATINIGRVSLDKTCSANAADAGSLAAASIYATAFNNLAQANANMEDSFDIAYISNYEVTYLEAQDYLNEAIMYALTASALAAAALVTASTPVICSFWVAGLASVALETSAVLALEEAYKALLAFNYCVQVLESIAESFHESQWKAFCNSVVSMDSAYESSYNSGFTYAFSNSCISPKLSDTQNDEFSLWMSSFTADSGGIDDWILAKPAKDGVYTWQDKVTQEHTVTVTLDLPKITSYEVQHTTGSYSEIIDLLDDVISQSSIIAGVLNSTAVTLAVIAVGFAVVFAYSVVSTVNCWCCGPYAMACCVNAPIWYAKAVALFIKFKVQQYAMVSTIAAIVAAAGALSMYLLQSNNDEAYDDWYPDGTTSIKNCQTCKPCRNDEDDDLASCNPCQAVSDLMIVRIAEVIMPYWYTICKTTQQHPGTSSGIMATNYPTLTSSSKASFSGGDVGNFESTYDAKITETK